MLFHQHAANTVKHQGVIDPPKRQFAQRADVVGRYIPGHQRAGVKCIAILVAVGYGNALASDKGDHERALQAVQSGQVLPLAKVLALIEKAHPGQVLEVELEHEKQQWQYEIKLLQPDGRLMKLQVDARTGEVLKRKTR